MNKQSILVVEDDMTMAMALRMVLQLPKHGNYQVETCKSGREALDMLNSYSFDMIISDLKLPDMEGMKLFEHASEHHPRISRVLITAYESPSVEEQAGRLTDAYIPKPFNLSDLVKVVQRIFESREAQL